MLLLHLNNYQNQGEKTIFSFTVCLIETFQLGRNGKHCLALNNVGKLGERFTM